MRFSGATALAVGVVLVGASPAAAGWGGGNDTSAELRRAVDVNGIKRHEAAFSLIGVATGGNRLAGTRGHELSADYVALQSRLAGLNVTRQDVRVRPATLLGDWKPPVLDVRRGKRYIPGIAGSIPGGDFGSMVNSPSGDVTAPVWAADLTIPSPAPEHVDLRLRGRGLRRHAAGRDRPAPARHLRRAVASGSTRRPRARAAIVYINEGDPDAPRGRPRRPALVRHGRAPGVTVPIVAAQIATVAGPRRRHPPGARRQDRAPAGRVPRRARSRPRT